jgi:hypothetical protein
MRKLMQEYGFPQTFPTVVFQDNEAAIHMFTTGRTNFKRSKHMHIRINYVKEHIDMGTIRIVFLPTDLMLADLLTKGFSKVMFIPLMDRHCIVASPEFVE